MLPSPHLPHNRRADDLSRYTREDLSIDTPDHEDRLTILERAQLLHDVTLHRHNDMSERHEERIALLTSLMEQQARTLTTLTEVAARLDTTLQAIRALLDRGRNGH